MKTKEQVLEQKRKYWNENKKRLNKERREWNKKNNEWVKERQKIWREKNKEHFNEWQRKNYKKNPKKHNKQNLETYYKNHEKYCLNRRIAIKKKREEQKKIVFNHYSKGKNCCEICGIIDTDVLTIDHINGNGSKHRKEIRGDHMENWLIKNNYPEGYRILCMNCQFKERKHKNQFNPTNRLNFNSSNNP